MARSLRAAAAVPLLCLAALLAALRREGLAAGGPSLPFLPGSAPGTLDARRRPSRRSSAAAAAASGAPAGKARRKVVVIGAGWGGLGAAHHLAKDPDVDVTIVDAAPRPGGLVSDGFTTPGGRRAEAGIHGFWDEYANIFSLVHEELGLTGDRDPFTDYADQGQYSPEGLEAVWPVYRDQQRLPTGLGQAVHTKFFNLSPLDRASAAPLTLAFSEFDDSPEAWERYDRISFRDLCQRLGVSRRMYDEAFEPMILTGLFAPGEQCSAAAALGMAYFFVLKQQNAFDVRWCRGNVGEKIFQPWVEQLRERGNVDFVPGCRAVDFHESEDGARMTAVRCKRQEDGAEFTLEADDVVFAVGMGALKAMARSPALAKRPDFAKFGNLRGTDVLATRIWLDRKVDTPYWANACWGFDEGVGMTWFDIGRLHAPAHDEEPGSVIEMDFYHSGALMSMSDSEVLDKVKGYLDTMVPGFRDAKVIDAAVVRLPSAVNWYFPGSYRSCPDTKASSFSNVYFAGDVVRTRHGSWSQEKAYVTGIEAANAIRGRSTDQGVKPLKPTEPHVAAGRAAVKLLRGALSGGRRGGGPSLADFLW